MNEQRIQAYINLIEQLLACADGEELNNILQANQELINPEFLQEMENYATWLEQQGNNNDAARLRNIAQQLGQYLNHQAVNLEQYQGFLSEILRAEIESDSDPTVVYPILQRRQHLLDDTFAQLLQQWARNVFSGWNAEEVAVIARVIQNLCNQIAQFTLGSRANNLEIAITGYHTLLEVYTREAFPYEWATTQNNLGNAYNERIRGKRTDNLELAIAAFQLSLGVFTRDAFPEQWATTQNNLGNAYLYRIEGEGAENLELAMAAFQQSLDVYNCQIFPEQWARSQNGLGIAYLYRIKGEISDNLELAIVAFQQSLSVFTREVFPEQWAMSQNNLGTVYNARIKGNKADNLELALTAYQQSLAVYSRETFPEKWASTQNNMGEAYRNRIRGEKADNIELAIAAFQQSLEVYSRETFPEKWARLQNNLGRAYRYRLNGKISDNLELAVSACQKALEIYIYEAFPSDWATAQNNLGEAYRNRIKGEKADNLELAITAFQQSLKVYNRETFPEDWQATQNNLGNAYLYRIRGERADNLELAIAAFQQSLEVFPREAFPEKWATTQNNLGIAYLYRIKGEKAENLELAIAAFQQSLEVFTHETFPEKWATTQNNLGEVYRNHIKGEKAENRELAIIAYQQSLKVVTRETFPEQWAMTQNNLGAAYSDRILGERADNLELAIVALNLSLEVYTPTAFPIECLTTGRNLGNAANLIEDRETAIKGYNLAIEAVENTRLEALNPQRQQEILSEAMDVYHGIVQSYLKLDRKDRALEYVERSKTRYLVQLLTDRDIYPKGNIPPTIITELDRLRRAIIGEEQRLAIQEQTRTLTLDQQQQPILNDYTYLNQLKQELNQFIDREITPVDPTFSLTQKVQSITLREIQSLIDRQTAILEWYIAGDSIIAFIVTSQGLKVWQSSADDRENLITFIKEYRDTYEKNKTKWINDLNNRLNELSEILHIDELLELIPDSCDRLILIPHWFLHIIPLHCLPLQNGQFLYQRFSKGVGYVPSCQLLKLVQSSRREKFERLFAIKNPTRQDLKPLLGANLEIERISQKFARENTIIIGESEASKQTLENRRQELQASHCIHFSCHGKFDDKSPRDSALLLADPEGNLGKSANLTLAEVFEKLDLRECRLVTFSACESGIIESKTDNISDEYVGLPSGFLFAGSSSVVSTLWTVDPLATTLFMAKFYHDLNRISIRDQGSIAIVLNNTQTWLRTLNSKKLARIKDNQKFQQILDRVFESKRDRNKFKDLLEAAVKREPYPFANPYYWTAFIATGV
ncbi:CHAT domain-containing tetratricopeptide repeat protein [Pannus brasiliensis CCIBt3594]|uniref:CHAT domain-containing tetratricopeptide repeat protein n=1 Tax=Pannus brasiliensis CCIBt3594 TaxID=1427578 RepID=A0AAW9QYN7_9CHRO